LVREQFRIADGEELGYSDPELRGHSFEFRINGEDPGRNFLPAPGALHTWEPPSGPGVRVDSGFQPGDVIGGNFDSLLAKLIVTGSSRQQALERSRRALAEFEVDGIATALTFHRVVVSDDDFAPADPEAPFKIHTRWIETDFDNQIPPYTGAAQEIGEAEPRQSVVVEVGGKRLDVSLPADMAIGGGGSAKKAGPKRARGKKAGAAASGDAVATPMQGTVVKIAVEEGQQVEAGDLIVVLEAMKMEQPLNAHRAGTVTGLNAETGATVPTGTVICEIKD
ncbi:MAG: biotin/lipoyl-binding protein, partial [Actinobacteria bacterium]|nr:biotin/lipoyl-binding protein [Actinomycetota bacterium]